MASIIFFLTLSNSVNFLVLMLLGYPICGLGIYFICRQFLKYKSFKNKFFDKYKNNSKFQIVDYCLIGFAFLFFFLSAIAPPTDADSLDYHLGYPMKVLRDRGYFPAETGFIAAL